MNRDPRHEGPVRFGQLRAPSRRLAATRRTRSALRGRRSGREAPFPGGSLRLKVGLSTTPVPQVQQQLERISALPKPTQRAVMDVIEALLAQPGR